MTSPQQPVFIVIDNYVVEMEPYSDVVGCFASREEAEAFIQSVEARGSRYATHNLGILDIYMGWTDI